MLQACAAVAQSIQSNVQGWESFLCGSTSTLREYYGSDGLDIVGDCLQVRVVKVLAFVCVCVCAGGGGGGFTRKRAWNGIPVCQPARSQDRVRL